MVPPAMSAAPFGSARNRGALCVATGGVEEGVPYKPSEFSFLRQVSTCKESSARQPVALQKGPLHRL